MVCDEHHRAIVGLKGQHERLQLTTGNGLRVAIERACHAREYLPACARGHERHRCGAHPPSAR
eukprot:2519381-Pyramimonas_sp.AAC.1